MSDARFLSSIWEVQPLNARSRTRHINALPGRAGQPWARAENRQEEWGISLWECQKVPKSAMSEQPQKSTKTQLALAVARGLPVAVWARTTGVPRRAAFRWAKGECARRSGLIGAVPHNRTKGLWNGSDALSRSERRHWPARRSGLIGAVPHKRTKGLWNGSDALSRSERRHWSARRSGLIGAARSMWRSTG